jgi:hypothetical protein
MESIEFINRYESYLDEINVVVKPELHPIIDELRRLDPHDLVKPETYFDSENSARGFVWSMFMKRARKYFKGE